MNDELFDDIKKFMFPLVIELQDHKGKVLDDAPVSPICKGKSLNKWYFFLIFLKR